MTAQTIGTVGALRRALRLAPALRRGLAGTVAFAVVGSLGRLVVPITLQVVIDRHVMATSGVDIGAVVWLGALAIVALATATIASRFAQVRMSTAAANGLCELRVMTFAHLHRLSVLHVQGERRGALVARVTSDVQEIQQFLSWGGVNLLLGVLRVVLVLAAMVVYRWELAVVVAVVTGGYAMVLRWFQRLLQHAYDQVRVRVADSMAEIFSAAVQAIVLVMGLFVLDGMSAGTLIAFMFLVNQFIEPVQTLVETLDQAQVAASGVRRILRVLDIDPDLDERADGRGLADGALAVRARGVRFAYGDGPDVLCDIDVEMPAGQRIAIVGETGSGKTTFAKLVVRLLRPDAGQILIGDVPLDEVSGSALRAHVAFVPQEGFLFDATLSDNVRYGDPAASDDQIRQAFADLDLDGWLAGLPAGIDSRVGQRGNRLSAGERQLVALVRAWIADPAVLVLDEATSAVDPALDVRLRDAIERLTAGRTSITIAHRLATAESADLVIVFDAGRIVARGTHAELLAGSDVYRRLHADWASGTTLATS